MTASLALHQSEVNSIIQGILSKIYQVMCIAVAAAAFLHLVFMLISSTVKCKLSSGLGAQVPAGYAEDFATTADLLSAISPRFCHSISEHLRRQCPKAVTVTPAL